MRSPAITYRGPQELNRPVERRGGPGAPPPGFVTATTSAEEWVGYWALAKAMQDPDSAHVRNPPFWGGLDWGYQIGDRVIGSAVIDYIVYLPGETVGIRLVTEYFHGEAGPQKNAFDEAQLLSLSRSFTIKDWYSQDFIEDASGESAVQSIIELLGGRTRLPLGVRLRRSRLYRR